MAGPSRSPGARWEASASGVKASVPLVSADHASVNPRSSSSETISWCRASGTPVSGIVSPHRDMRASSANTGTDDGATVDDHGLAGHPARRVAGQEHDGVRDVLGLADPAERHELVELLLVLLPQCPGQMRPDDAG